jgi:hypothetical protein
MPTKSFAIKRPKFYDYFTLHTETTRVCHEDGCEKPASVVGGHYYFKGRRVRVWVCPEHQVDPLQDVGIPKDLQAALDMEAAYYEEAREKDRLNGGAGGRTVSVKTFGAGGWGDPVPGDRVKQWRWGE